jgi:4-amino-4-deoxy-L-arabinose transferase-like glycosyltransferase
MLLGWQPFVGSNAEDHYLPTARRLLAEHRFNGPDTRPDSKVPPGYPILLAGVAGFTADPVDGVVFIQILADLVTALCIFAIMSDLGSPRSGALAAVIWQCFPPAIVISTWITAETIFTTVFIAALLVFIRAMRSASPSQFAIAGLLLGIATLIRSTPIAMPLLLVYFCLRSPKRLRCTAAFLLASFSPIALWAARNIVVLQDPIPVSVGFGSTFLQGSEERVFTGSGKNALYPGIFARAAEAGIRKPLNDKESQIDRWMLRVGAYNYQLRWHHRAWSFVAFIPLKVVRLFYGTESGSPRGEGILFGCSIIVLSFALPAFPGLYRKSRDQSVLMILVIGYFIALHTVTLPEFRYVLPCFPLLVAMAAEAAVMRFWTKNPSPERSTSPSEYLTNVDPKLC